MSSITAADLKLGGRVVTACDAIGAGHLRRAAGIFAEIADDLNREAEETTGLLSEEPLELTEEVAPPTVSTVEAAGALAATGLRDTADLQMCARNVHAYGAPAMITGWRTCSLCGNVNVAPPGDGPVDMGARNEALGDL